MNKFRTIEYPLRPYHVDREALRTFSVARKAVSTRRGEWENSRPFEVTGVLCLPKGKQYDKQDVHSSVCHWIVETPHVRKKCAIGPKPRPLAFHNRLVGALAALNVKFAEG
jgi:hypothetical protein